MSSAADRGDPLIHQVDLLLKLGRIPLQRGIVRLLWPHGPGLLLLAVQGLGKLMLLLLRRRELVVHRGKLGFDDGLFLLRDLRLQDAQPPERPAPSDVSGPCTEMSVDRVRRLLHQFRTQLIVLLRSPPARDLYCNP